MHDPLGEYGGHSVYYDEAGFRAPSREASNNSFADRENTIVFLGDSFTEGNQVSFEDTFASLIGSEVGANVVNLGVSSYSPIIYLLQAKNIVSDFEADTVILQVFSNDFSDDASYIKDAVFVDSDITGVNGGGNNAFISLLRKSYLARFFRKSQLLINAILVIRTEDQSHGDNDFFYEPSVTKAQMAATVNTISKIDRYLTSQGKSHAFIKQAGNRSNSILRLSIKKPCYNSYPQSSLWSGSKDRSASG